MNTPPPIQDITLRDYFAAAALTGLLANGDRLTVVKQALKLADQMIKERQNAAS
jgi:hypothetical protein